MGDSVNCSAEELRLRLFESFRGKGLLDSLKSQLRSRLVSLLRESRPMSPSSHNENPQSGKATSATDRAANSLVADHLQRNGYEYTLAIFLPESGTKPDEVFAGGDLLRLLGIRPDSMLHHRIERLEASECKGFLWQLLSELTNQHTKPQADVSVQTDTDSRTDTSTSLNAKLHEVETKFSRRQADSEGSVQLQLEERMQAYQRQCDTRARAETRLQIEQFKETQLTRMKLQEQEKCQLEISRSRTEMEHKYQEKLAALHSRELETTEMLKRQQREQEAQLHAQRQSLLEELNVVRMREAAVKRDAELNAKAAQIGEERVQHVTEQVRMKESGLESEKKRIERGCEEKLEIFKKEFVEEQRRKLGDLETTEKKLEAQQRTLREHESRHQRLLEELREQQELVSDMQVGLRNAEREKELLTVKIEQNARDSVRAQHYESLQEQNRSLRKEVSSLQDKLRETIVDSEKKQSDQRELIRELKIQMSKPAAEELQLRVEVRELRDATRKQQLVTAHEKQQLMSRLQAEADSNRELRHQIDEHQLTERELRRELSDLRLLQDQTQTALDAEFQHSSRRTNTHLKSLGIDNRENGSRWFETGKAPESQHVVLLSGTRQRTDHRNAAHATVLDQSHLQRKIEQSNIFGLSSTDVDLPPVESLAFLEQTKQTFERLENEAAELERSYQAFQMRLAQGTFPSSPPIPESRHDSLLVLQSSIPSATRSEERDHLPKQLLARRQTSSKANAAIHTSSQRLMDSGLSGVPNSDWVTRLEVKKPSVTAVKPVDYHEGIREDSQPDQPIYKKQSVAPSISETEESSLDASSVQQVVSSPAIEQPVSSLQAGVPSLRSEADVVSGEASTTPRLTTRIAQETEKQGFGSGSELKLPLTSGKHEQEHAATEGQVDEPGSGIANTSRSVVTENQQTLASARVISLDNTWKASTSKETMNDAVTPSLENTWKSNSQTVTGSQLTEDQFGTEKPNRTEVTLPSIIGVSSSVVQQRNSSEIASPQREHAREDTTSKYKEDEDLDEWEKRREQRKEERRQREEAAHRREQEELERLQAEQQEREKGRSEQQEQLGLGRSVGKSADEKEDEGEDNDDNIDPTMLQYMKLISQKREAEKVAEKTTKLPAQTGQDEDWSLPSESHSVGVLASVGGASDDESDW